MSLFQALDESEKSPGHGWNTSNRFGLDSTNGGGKQYDSQGSSTNIFHHLINQNNTGEVPDALAEEEVINDNEVQTDCSFNLNQQQQQKQQQQQNQQHMQQIQQQQQNALQHQFQQQQMQKQHLLNQQHQQQQQKHAMMNTPKQVLPQPSPRGKTPQQQQQQQQHKSPYPVLNNNKQQQQHTQLDQQQQHQLLQQQQLQTQFARQQQQQQSMQQQMLSQAQSQSARLQQQHAAQQQMISQAQMQNRLLQQQQQQVLKQQPGQNLNMQQGVGRNKPLPQPHHNQLVQQQLSQQLVKNSVEKIEEDLNRKLLQTEQEIEENNKTLAMFGLPPVSVQHSQLPTMNNCDYLGSVRVNHSGNQAGSGDGRIRTMLTHSKETLQKKGNINVMDNSAPVNQNVQRQTISHGQVGGQISGQQPRIPIITVSAGQRLNLPPQSQMVRSPMKSGIVQLPSPSMPGNRPTSAPTQSPVQVQTVSTNQSLIRQPPPASAMMKINKSNVVLEGGGQFEEGQAYVIKDRHGNSRTMVWTNGEFVPYDKDKGNYNQIQHSTIDSSQRGRGARGGRGGRAARGRGQLQGNPTGVHMTQNLQGNSPLMNNGLRQVHPNGPINKTMSYQGPGHPQYHQQIGQMSTPGHVIHQSQSTPNLISVVTTPSVPGQVSVQRPKLALQNLMPAQQIKQKSGDTGQNEVPPSTSAEKVEQKPAATTIIAVIEKDAPVLDPPNVPDDPTACAVCQFCGTTSMDKYKCESCKRMFTSATKYVIPKCDGEGEIKRRKLEPLNTVAILTAGVDKNVFYPRKLVDQGEVYLKVISTTNTVTSKTPRIIRSSVAGRGRRGRGRGRGMAVPELVTISSDEEDGGDPNLSISRSAPATPVPSRSPSQHGDQLEGPELIPIIPVSKRVDKARVKKMEDAEGANARENSPSPPAQFTLTARTIRVGTFRGAPVEPVLISQNGLSFFIEGVTGTHRFVLFPQEIQQCLAKFDSEPNLIFFLTNEGCAGRTRKDLGMAVYSDHTKPPPELYFNPSSLEMRHQMITIVSDQLSVETRLEFQKYMELFKSWGKQGDEAFFMELSKEEADEIYRQSTTTTPLTHFTICTTSFSQGEEDRQGDRSPSPKIGFVGPVIKLLTYPPPPEKGGISITNEDLYCLQEGEFLNDVIIDFYLKYLLRDKLSAEDRERTHIFSSFFYKRLTQRIRGATIDEDPNITLAEKRHARVKTWTKHVDLFKKDFIVVPINEHAHWFLAIICFPSLDKPVENPFIPKLVSNTFLDTASVPTPPQPTEDGQEDMETEESEDPYNEMEAGAQQVKKEKQEEVAASETNGQTKELTVEKDKVEKQSTETEQSENQSEEKTESQSEQTDSQAEKSEDQSEKSESQSEKASTQSDGDGTNTETAESQSEKLNCGKEESNASNSSEKASEKSNVIQKADGTPAEKSVTKVAKVPKTPVLVRSIRGKAIPKSDPLPPEASVGIRQPCIIIFDSLVGPSRSRIIQVLKEYLQVEWAVKKGGTELNKGMIKGCSAKVQQQTNYSDCGVYMLQYVESFFEDPIQDFSIPVRLVDWFSIPKIEAKREEIRDLVIGLKEKYESKNNT